MSASGRTEAVASSPTKGNGESPSVATSAKYELGDLVWAKMKGFSPWPGKVTEPVSANMRKPPGNYKHKPIQCVYFFGSNNYAWIQEDAIKPYQEYKEQYCKLNKSHAFKEAIAVIDDYIKNGNQFREDQLPPPPSGDKSPELSTIFTGGEKAADDSKGQRDYSRTPFKKQTKKLSSSKNHTNDDQPPAKKLRGSTVSASAASAEVDGNSVSSPATKSNSKAGARNILQRTSQYLLDTNSTGATDGNDIDVEQVSAKSKTIQASKLKFGFIGLGLMGQRLLKNLLNSGHNVTIWNRTPSKCKDFAKIGATKVTTPADVVAAADIVFSCLADPLAVKEIVFGNCGVLADMTDGKGYVEMSAIDAETSNDVSEAIIARGGRYLEAPIIGSGKQRAEEGNLTVIAAGDKSLFDDCNSCFEAISKHAYYLGSHVGDAAKMGLITSMLMGNMIGALAESMALADRTGIQQKDFLEILSLSPLASPTVISKAKAMIEGGFATEMPLTHMQKDLRLALQLGETYEHPLPITASTNEVFKHAKHLGYSEHDVAAVYIRSRF